MVSRSSINQSILCQSSIDPLAPIDKPTVVWSNAPHLGMRFSYKANQLVVFQAFPKKNGPRIFKCPGLRIPHGPVQHPRSCRLRMCCVARCGIPEPERPKHGRAGLSQPEETGTELRFRGTPKNPGITALISGVSPQNLSSS